MVTIALALDEDGDGLLDSWELSYSGFSSNAFNASSLIGWWDLNSTNVADRSANNISGTLSGTTPPSSVVGLFSNALSFSGDGHVNFSTNNALALTNDYTISTWFYGSPSGSRTVIAKWDGNSGNTWELAVETNGVTQMRFYSGSSTQDVMGTSGPVNVRDDAFHHLAAVYTKANSNLVLYVDANSEVTATVSEWTGSVVQAFAIGNSLGGNPAFILDETRLYFSAISGADIDKLPETYADFDLDSLSNFQEQQAGTDPLNSDSDGDSLLDGVDGAPLDFYNGTLPTLRIVSGDKQLGYTNSFLGRPLIVEATGIGGAILTNAPITFAIASGSGKVATSTVGTLLTSIQVLAGSDGRASIYHQLGSTLGAANSVTATATTGTNSTQATFTSAALSAGRLFAGLQHSFGLKGDGTVWSWGENFQGQLGNKGSGDHYYPSTFGNLTNFVSLAGGEAFSVGLKLDGTVWAWGDGLHGQIGNGATSDKLVPTQTSTLANIIAVAAGESHGLALHEDATVWSWGRNNDGQLGIGNTVNTNQPRQISTATLSNVTAVTASGTHSHALKSDGTLMSWGNNAFGQLGDNTTTDRTTPVAVTNFTGVTSIAAGLYHTVALKSDGTVWAWGRNQYGEVGDGTTTQRKVPTQVSGLSGVTAVAAGEYHSLALKSDGTVWAWGRNHRGQLADGTFNNSSTAIQSAAVTNVVSVAAGQHTLMAQSDGIVKSSGGNSGGQRGIGNTNITSSVTDVLYLAFAEKVALPVISPDGGFYTVSQTVTVTDATSGCTIRYTLDGSDPTGNSTSIASGGTLNVTGLTRLKVKAFKSGVISSDIKSAIFQIGDAVAAGQHHGLALEAGGTLWSWGDNAYGQLGNDSSADRWAPVQVTAISNVISVAGGEYHTLAVKSDGTTWVWGRNTNNQLGDGTTTERDTPVSIGLSSVRAIAAGFVHSVALKTDGTVWAWGKGTDYRLGSGSSTNNVAPAVVPNVSQIQRVTAGDKHTMALRADGTLWGWGDGGSGKLGDGTLESRSTAIQIGTIVDVVGVSAGDSHTVAVKSDGTVWAWGLNTYGQLGDGTTTQSELPVQAVGITNAVWVAAGTTHTVVMKADGSTVAFGRNNEGSVGDNSTTNRTSPVQVSGMTDNVKAIAAGTHSIAIRNYSGANVYWAWGKNDNGQLGDDTTTDRLVPVEVHLPIDSDGDGLVNWQESQNGTDPGNTDSNGDGFADGLSVSMGIDPASNDVDGDGLTNAQELALGTYMFIADSDGDGVNDGADAYPLDPYRSSVTFHGGDSTAPTITLEEPTNATLVP
jgi:alpha-tubulin suppressor-like RCC1 family protein